MAPVGARRQAPRRGHGGSGRDARADPASVLQPGPGGHWRVSGHRCPPPYAPRRGGRRHGLRSRARAPPRH
eukprot:430941-Pyramimonas_sp.AAC.1